MNVDSPESSWEAAALRMTAFPAPGSEFETAEWWKSLVGNLPEQRTEQPRTGEILETSEYGNGRLELKIDPIRLAWIYQVQLDVIQPEKGVETLGELHAELDEFRTLINSWFELETVPNLVRLAFGGILIIPVQSQEQGLGRLAGYIPDVKIDPSNTSDFLYQINRRRVSKLDIEGLEINRLTKWSVVQHQLLLVRSDGSGSATPASPVHHARLEIDVNTFHEYEREFQQEQLPKVFAELVELGTELAELGDIP